MRTAFREVENLQTIAAKAGRLALNGGPDFFGEEVILEQLGDFLRSKGVSAAEINDQLLSLTSADATKAIPTDPLRLLDMVEPAHGLEPSALLDERPGTPTPTGEIEEGEATTTKAVVDEDLQLASEERASAEQAEAPEGFVIQLTLRKVRRLHFVGCCPKVPGEHYKVYEAYGTMLPNEYDFDCLCKSCFKGGAFDLGVTSFGPDQPPQEIEASSSSSSSSSSDSDDKDQRVVRRNRPR